MIGHISKQEFAEQYGKQHVDHAVIKYGKWTYNYYTQHEDGSWTNYAVETFPPHTTTK
jgi:hypothetical protein